MPQGIHDALWPQLFQEEESHAIVPYFLLTVLFGGATTPCARALAELGAALEAYVDVFPQPGDAEKDW